MTRINFRRDTTLQCSLRLRFRQRLFFALMVFSFQMILTLRSWRLVLHFRLQVFILVPGMAHRHHLSSTRRLEILLQALSSKKVAITSEAQLLVGFLGLDLSLDVVVICCQLFGTALLKEFRLALRVGRQRIKHRGLVQSVLVLVYGRQHRVRVVVVS